MHWRPLLAIRKSGENCAGRPDWLSSEVHIASKRLCGSSWLPMSRPRNGGEVTVDPIILLLVLAPRRKASQRQALSTWAKRDVLLRNGRLSLSRSGRCHCPPHPEGSQSQQSVIWSISASGVLLGKDSGRHRGGRET